MRSCCVIRESLPTNPTAGYEWPVAWTVSMTRIQKLAKNVIDWGAPPPV
jgi:hypothetical protein